MPETQLMEEAEKALKQCPQLATANLSVQVQQESIILGGKVSTFYQKQMAQETIIRMLQPRMQQGLTIYLANEIRVSE